MNTTDILLMIIVILIAVYLSRMPTMNGMTNGSSLNNNTNSVENNIENNDIAVMKGIIVDKDNELEQLKHHVMENKIRTEIIQDNQDANNTRYNRVHDPLTAPERSYPFMMNRNKVPINIETRGKSMEFQQVGFIHSDSSNEEKVIFPLYGKQIWRGSSKWSYYSGTDKIHQIKLPVVHNKRQCLSETGCDELYDGDVIDVPPYKDKFKVEIYNLDSPKYIPL